MAVARPNIQRTQGMAIMVLDDHLGCVHQMRREQGHGVPALTSGEFLDELGREEPWALASPVAPLVLALASDQLFHRP
jgi:hypothetical protein